MLSRIVRFLFPHSILSSSILFGILLSCVQVIIIALIPQNLSLNLIYLFLLLYLVVPFLVCLLTKLKSKEYRIGQLGCICTSLVTCTTLATFVYSTISTPFTDNNIFNSLPLSLYLILSVIVLFTLNIVGIALALTGELLGSLLYKAWIYFQRRNFNEG